MCKCTDLHIASLGFYCPCCGSRADVSGSLKHEHQCTFKLVFEQKSRPSMTRTVSFTQNLDATGSGRRCRRRNDTQKVLEADTVPTLLIEADRFIRYINSPPQPPHGSPQGGDDSELTVPPSVENEAAPSWCRCGTLRHNLKGAPRV